MQNESTPLNINEARKEFRKQQLLSNCMAKEAQKAFKRFWIFGFLILLMLLCNFQKQIWTCLPLWAGVYLCGINGCGALCFYMRNLFKKELKNEFENALSANECVTPLMNNNKNMEMLTQTEISPIDFLKQCKQNTKIRNDKRQKLNTIWSDHQTAKSMHINSTTNAADLIHDEQDLDKYLSRIEREKETNLKMECKKTKGNLLGNLVYQPAPLVFPATTSPKRYNENLQLEPVLQDIIGYAIYQDDILKFIFHLRDWISTTILKPLIDEIEYINGVLVHSGYHNLCIGKTPWHVLHTLIANDLEFVNSYIPRLTVILPYLEICSNQIYLLDRLRELAVGAYLNAYQVNSALLSQQTHLPNDAAIIFNFFCIYMDMQLKIATVGKFSSTQGRPFFDKYVIMENSKNACKSSQKFQIRNNTKCGILCISPTRPKFNLVIENKILQCGSSYNNLFYVLIAFLSYMHKHNGSCLEGVQLGRKGLNMLWIVEIGE